MSLRSLLSSLVVLFLLLAAVRPAAAINVVEPVAFGSWRSDPSNFALGGGVSLGIGSLAIVPTAEYVFADNSTDWALNIDAHVPLIPLGVVALYVGGGLGRYWSDPDGGESSGETGVNLLGGLAVHVKKLKPYAEFKYTFAGPDNFVFTLGTHFNVVR